MRKLEEWSRHTIDWLKQNQAHGAFEGHPEDTMNFELLDLEEIE